MTYQEGNIYGVQRVEEIKPRSKKDMVLSSAALAGQGAQIGSILGGPVGMAAGAIIGGGVGLIVNRQGKLEEERQMRSQQQYNRYVGSLDDRALPNQQVVGGQDYHIPMGEHGMKANRYLLAEIEGDGSGKASGAGEIVTDRNYNVKQVASGAPTHEEGGKKVQLNDGDIVFPTQGSKESERKILSAISRYKLRGDGRAKKYLDAEVSKLPTAEENGSNKFPDGKQPGDDHFLERRGAPYLNDGPDPWDNFDISGESKSPEKDPWDTLFERSKRWSPEELQSYANENKLNWTDIPEQAQRRGVEIGDLGKGSSDQSKNWGPLTAGYFSSKPAELATVPSKTDGLLSTGKIAPQKLAPMEETPIDVGYNFLMDEGDSSKLSAGGGHENLLKYASSAYNIVKGMEPAEQVTRRNMSFDPYEYKDTSHAQRQAILENRNYMSRYLGGRVDRMGSQATQGQVSAQHLGQMGAVNERESAQQNQVKHMNTDLTDRNRGINFEWANRYDEMDAQNRAAKQKFLGTGLAEASELGQMYEQRQYMKDRNAKQYDIQDKTIGVMGTPNFRYNQDWWTGPQYTKE